LDIEYSTLDIAIERLKELKERHSTTHMDLRLESKQDRYSDGYSLWLTGYREESDREILDRQETEASQLRYEKNQYERLKTKFEKK
jgi:hypothetical protein